MNILNLVAALFLFPKNIKECVYFTGNQTVAAEHDSPHPPTPMALGCTPPPGNGTLGRLLGQYTAEGGGSGDRLETTQRPSPWHSFSGVSGSSVIVPFRFLRKRNVQAHICPHRDSAQLEYLKPVYCRWLG